MAAKSPDSAAVAALRETSHADPFAVLGMHRDGNVIVVRSFLPGQAKSRSSMRRPERSPARCRGSTPTDPLRGGDRPPPVRRFATASRHRGGGAVESEDIYRFPPVLGDLMSTCSPRARTSGELMQASARRPPCARRDRRRLPSRRGARTTQRVSLIGDFNDWDDRRFRCAAARLRRLGAVRPGPGTGRCDKCFLRRRWRPPLEGRPACRGRLSIRRTPLFIVAAPPPPQRSPRRSWLATRAQRNRSTCADLVYEVHLAGGGATTAGGNIIQPSRTRRAAVPYVRDMVVQRSRADAVELIVSLRRLLGLSAHSLYAPTSRSARRGFRFVDACSPRRDRRHPRLGPGAFPERSTWPPFRRHAPL